MTCRFKINITSWPKLCSLTIIQNGWWHVSDLTGERRLAIFRHPKYKVHVYPSGKAVACSEEGRDSFIESVKF